MFENNIIHKDVTLSQLVTKNTECVKFITDKNLISNIILSLPAVGEAKVTFKKSGDKVSVNEFYVLKHSENSKVVYYYVKKTIVSQKKKSEWKESVEAEKKRQNEQEQLQQKNIDEEADLQYMTAMNKHHANLVHDEVALSSSIPVPPSMFYFCYTIYLLFHRAFH